MNYNYYIFSMTKQVFFISILEYENTFPNYKFQWIAMMEASGVSALIDSDPHLCTGILSYKFSINCWWKKKIYEENSILICVREASFSKASIKQFNPKSDISDVLFNHWLFLSNWFFLTWEVQEKTSAN